MLKKIIIFGMLMCLIAIASPLMAEPVRYFSWKAERLVMVLLQMKARKIIFYEVGLEEMLAMA